MLLVLDNYDSFTFNLVQYLGELAADYPLAAEVRVERNDALDLEQIRALGPAAILISPGPGDPDQAGVCLEVLRELGPTVPVLGVCLGHQCLAQVFGGRVVRARELMHGKTSPVHHRGAGVFRALYHRVESEARSAGNVCGIRLYMEHANERARAAYLRLGLTPAGYEVLEKDFVLGPG